MIMQFHTGPLTRSSHKVEDKGHRPIEVFVTHPDLVPMWGQMDYSRDRYGFHSDNEKCHELAGCQAWKSFN